MHKVTEFVWFRLGDKGEYQYFDHLDEVITYFKDSVFRSTPEQVRMVGSKLMISPGYEGRNYISLFYGDDDAQMTRELTGTEARYVMSELKKPVEEDTAMVDLLDLLLEEDLDIEELDEAKKKEKKGKKGSGLKKARRIKMLKIMFALGLLKKSGKGKVKYVKNKKAEDLLKAHIEAKKAGKPSPLKKYFKSKKSGK